MGSTEILSTYVKKLSHPLKEIRERSLQLLIAKMELGWELEDELSNTRELVEALLAWFNVQQPTLQQEALNLLLKTIKTKSGSYIVKEVGIKKMLSTLSRIKAILDPDAMETYYDVIETLRFLNTVQSETSVVPPLSLQSLGSSESESGSSGYYHLGPNFQSSKEPSESDEDVEISKCDMSQTPDGVKVLLLPWVNLCVSDSKTMVLVEDALKLLKSTRRCCRFIRDVFLRDFPAEIFLNRPTIVKSLITIADGGNAGRPEEALHVLLNVTQALRVRIRQLSSLELVHEATKVTNENRASSERLNVELEFLGDGQNKLQIEEDGLAALKQIPVPIFALDTLLSTLTIMARSVALVEPVDFNEGLNLRETNISLSLVENLISLLLDCADESFWCREHNSKTLRDIAHKSCLVMRLLGDLLVKYKKLFLDDTNRSHYRVAWLRLVVCAEQLLHWARHSAMPPSSLVHALQSAQLDPALELLYPQLNTRLCSTLQNSKITVDQEHKTKYKELRKLFTSMDDAAQFMKNKNGCRETKTVLQCIKNSLPVLELHLSENYLNDIAAIILKQTKHFDMNEEDWSLARSIALTLMANGIEWVQGKFYRLMAEMVRSVLVGDETTQKDNEQCLTLLCDVGILTEICCHGLCSTVKEVESSASDIMVYLLRGRLVLSEGCWWRLLASLLPVLPLLQVYAAHDTQLGQAICKSLHPDIAECMGISMTEVTMGLVRLLFIKCPAVQMDAAHLLCCILDDERYLPPKESLRTDVLMTALGRVEPQDFNVDHSTPVTKHPQTTGLIQILDVLKQDLVLDELGVDFVARSSLIPILEPSMRRNTLQQLSVMLQQQELHETFLNCDGLRIIVAILRISMMVDDYLAFPECAISCVSIINSVCFMSRHALAKITDLTTLLLRVILVFPANESAVLMSAQVLSLVAWSGFILQELNSSRHRVPALPHSVAQKTNLPFAVNSYWKTSPNAEHSPMEWLLSDEEWRSAIRVRWWCACEGSTRVLRDAPPPPAPLSLRPTSRDLASLRTACPNFASTKALMNLENATSHRQVNDALNTLESYTHLLPISSIKAREFGSLPWHHMRRFLHAPPASSRDTTLLITLLNFVISYMNNIPDTGITMSWIKTSFIGNDASIISLLSRDELYVDQTQQESIEVTQLHIHIVKVLLKCIVMLEYHNEYDSNRLESLVKILLACLQRIDLKNFHVLGYLNELVRCIRYTLNSRYCKLSQDTSVQCMSVLTTTLAGCASGGGMKGQSCRLDALLALLALLRQVHEEQIPVQRWSELWSSEVVSTVVRCTRGSRADVRAAALNVVAALAHHAQLLPQLLQAIPVESLSMYAADIFSQEHEANVVRTAAAALLTTLSARPSPHTDMVESEILSALADTDFLENCLEILVNFCNEKDYKTVLEPNLPISILERRSELEVRSEKCGDIRVSPSLVAFRGRPPPTAALVSATANLLYNISAFPRCPVQEWNDRGLYRLLFKCASWSRGSAAENQQIQTASCRVLYAAATHKRVRETLATTKDCLHNFMLGFKPFDEDEWTTESISARIQALLFVASLLLERTAADNIWKLLRESLGVDFFNTLLQCLEFGDNELQQASIYCLTQVSQSAANKKYPDRTTDTSRVVFMDNIKSPYAKCSTERQGAGDSARDDCQPEYTVEEICKILMQLYVKFSADNKSTCGQDDRWASVCSCLSSILSISPRARMYGVHRQLPRVLLATLQAARDRLSLHGSVDGLKNAAQNPILKTVYWLLTTMSCQMTECLPAKETFVDDNIALSLNRLWPWCMLTEQLRDAIMHLLFVFTNNCSKAWASMSNCIGGRCLVGEVCALTSREAALQSRPRPDSLLLICLKTLRHVVGHHQCRAVILKSDVLQCMYKLRVRERTAGGTGAAGVEWARLCEAAARHADGAQALLALKPLLTAPPVRCKLLPALAHVARHRRAAVLQSPDLLELLSGTLLAGDTAEIVSAARAIWALAANNHKAKLQLRSAGIASAVQSALQRVQQSQRDSASNRALQILIYTNNVLQST